MVKTLKVLILSTIMCMSTITAFASDKPLEIGPGIEITSNSDTEISSLYGVKIIGTSENNKLDVIDALSKIDSNALKAFNTDGGKIYLKEHIYHQGSEVQGLTTFSDNMILVSTSLGNVRDTLLHEFGHYIYENSTYAPSKNALINQVYQNWNKYNPYFYDIHETYAQLYRYVKTDSNFMDYLDNTVEQTVLEIEQEV